jgi:phage terminase large subunit-like protein
VTSASPAEQLARRLVAELGPSAHKAVDLALAKMPIVERAALAYNWHGFWARPKQLLPDGPWRSFGLLTGRAFGKTRTLSEFVTAEVMAGRARRVALCAPTEDDTRDVMVEGESGLLNVAPPWFKPDYQAGNGRIVYPNGAVAFLYSANAPEHFRGPEHALFWGDELGSWPANTWADAWSNMRMGLRLGYAKLVWSSTPRTVPLIAQCVARAKARPEQHILVRGSTLENLFIPAHVREELLAEYGGTRLGRQELEGEYLEDLPGALFTQRVITENRRRAPDAYVRTVVAVDPAISTRAGSDQTGIVVAGLGPDGRIYIIDDLSGSYPPERWAKLVVGAYRHHECDLIIIEDNRGGNLNARNIRAEDPKIPPERIKDTHAWGRKESPERAGSVSTLYEKGRVAHVVGANLAELEKQMVEWDPSATKRSPDRIDAMVYAVLELAKLGPKDKVFDDYAGGDRAPSRLDGRVREAMAEEADDWDDDDAATGGRW